MPFKNRRLGKGDYEKEKKNRNSKKKNVLKKNSPHVHNKIASALHGPQTGSRGSGRQARSLRGEDQWFGRDSQLHIIGQSPAPGRTSSVLGQGRKAPGPSGIYKYLPDPLRLLQKQIRKLTADYLQTVSGISRRQRWAGLGGWGLWGQSSHSSPEGPGLGPLPRRQALQGTGLSVTGGGA